MPHKIEYYGFCDQSKTLHIETRDCKNWVPQLDEPVEPSVIEAHAPATPATATIERVIEEHETNYFELPNGDGWQWSCRCGAKEGFDDRDACVHQTRQHWAAHILADLEYVVAEAAPATPAEISVEEWLPLTITDATCIVHDILKQYEMTKDFGRTKDYGATLILGAIERSRRGAVLLGAGQGRKP